MPIRTGGRAPYAPPQAVLALIESFRERGLTTPFTADVLMRAGVNESLVPRTLRTLQDLDLIDADGNPTPDLEGLRRATAADFKDRLAAIVRSVYAEVFQFTDPAKDDAGRIADAFRAFEPIGQRSRMVTLFLGLCEAAGIVPANATRSAAPAPSRQRPTTSKRAAPAPRASAVGVAHASATAVLVPKSGIPAAIMGLLASLPPEGTPWTASRRTALTTAFGHVLEFCYPDAPPDPSAEGTEAQ